MMSPELIDQAPILAGAPYNIARVRGIQDYPLVTTLCRIAFDTSGRFSGMKDLYADTFLKAGIGMDNDGRFIRLRLTQYCGIDGWQFVTKEEALHYLMIEVEREKRWLAGIYATLNKWGFYEHQGS